MTKYSAGLEAQKIKKLLGGGVTDVGTMDGLCNQKPNER